MNLQSSFLLTVLVTTLAVGCSGNNGGSTELLNVSYDPTRELWTDLNRAFVEHYEKQTGTKLTINMSHGGSGSQARSVIDGLPADVVTLALWSDTNAIAKVGLLKEGWSEQPYALPYRSTIVFVVRKGNPKQIKDWPDLERPGVQVITPNPKTSGNGQLSLLAAWGSVIDKGGTEEQARAFVTKLYKQVPVLDPAARGATVTFARKKIGDVHLTWENEAHLEVEEAKGELEIVYPKASIRAEPYVALVDKNVDRKGSRAHAEAYLKFLHTPEGQEIIARFYFRPVNPEVLARHTDKLPDLKLFPITTVAKDWDDAKKKFFIDGGVYDEIARELR